jgi:single-stranded DNA-specific DHH superfamily exonuclease
VVLLQQQGDVCKGSARSIDGYSIHEGLTAASQHLTSFGGHEAAAGLALPSANLEALTAALVEHANTHISVEQLTPTLKIDCDAGLQELDLSTVRRIRTLSPFGQVAHRVVRGRLSGRRPRLGHAARRGDRAQDQRVERAGDGGGDDPRRARV